MQIVNYNVSQGKLLSFSSFLKASLHDTATMFMRAYLNAVIDACIENELGKSLILLAAFAIWFLGVLRRFKNAQESLNHMVSVSTLNNLN
jgi:hypothetical protein